MKFKNFLKKVKPLSKSQIESKLTNISDISENIHNISEKLAQLNITEDVIDNINDIRFLVEGGNARGTNKKTGKDTLAQKIPIKEIGRSEFIKKFVALFMEINKRYKHKYKEPLWKDTSIIKNGTVFNGSTSFIMNPEIHDDEVIPYKKTAGDIDIMIPSEKAEKLWYLLDELEGETVMKDVVYKGCNRLTPSAITDQINSVFEVKFGDIVTQSQVDYELAAFDKQGKPDNFSRFAHSSSLSDAQKGFKGFSHKVLLRALAGGSSRRDDVIVITPKSTYEKYSIKKTKGVPIVPNFLKFSVTRGLRYAYEKQLTPSGDDWILDGKKVYKEIPSKTATYETAIINIYKIMFGDADDKDLHLMWSFTGLIDLMKKHFNAKQKQETFDRLVDICWGPVAQKLERDSASIDLEIKSNTVNYLIKKLKVNDSKVQKMIDTFYKNY